MSSANQVNSRNLFHVPTFEEAIQTETQSLQGMPKTQWGTDATTRKIEGILNLVIDSAGRVRGRLSIRLMDRAQELGRYYRGNALGPTTLTDEAFGRLKGICAEILEEVQAPRGRPQFSISRRLRRLHPPMLPPLANSANHPTREPQESQKRQRKS